MHTFSICHGPQGTGAGVNLDDKETLENADIFCVPVLINSNLRGGSLRQAAAERRVRMLLYEAGESFRFDEVAIRAGRRHPFR